MILVNFGFPFPIPFPARVNSTEHYWATSRECQRHTSSGALGGAAAHALGELIPLIVRAPADQRKRNRWLKRLWRAVQLDGISYLALVEENWGELCGSADVASCWADKILPALRAAWSDWRPGAYVKGTDLCLSSLLTAGRYRELLDVLALKQHPVWPWRRYGIRALLAQTLFDEALVYAEASRGLNIPDAALDAECEAILLAAGRREEAYRQYALTANQADVGLVTFQRITRKYPEIDRRDILADLAELERRSWQVVRRRQERGLSRPGPQIRGNRPHRT